MGRVPDGGDDVGEVYTDCRSDDGITVGLIDSIITACRVLRTRDLSSPAVAESLRDLIADDDFNALILFAPLRDSTCGVLVTDWVRDRVGFADTLPGLEAVTVRRRTARKGLQPPDDGRSR